MLSTVQIRDVIICSKTFSLKGPTKERVVIGNAKVKAHLLTIVSGEKEAFPFIV